MADCSARRHTQSSAVFASHRKRCVAEQSIDLRDRSPCYNRQRITLPQPYRAQIGDQPGRDNHLIWGRRKIQQRAIEIEQQSRMMRQL